MINAIILLNVVPARVNEVAEKLVSIPGVSEAYSVGGRFDIVAMVRARDIDGISEVVTRQLLQIDGITSSETLIAFRAVSGYDLERIFDLD